MSAAGATAIVPFSALSSAHLFLISVMLSEVLLFGYDATLPLPLPLPLNDTLRPPPLPLFLFFLF